MDGIDSPEYQAAYPFRSEPVREAIASLLRAGPLTSRELTSKLVQYSDIAVETGLKALVRDRRAVCTGQHYASNDSPSIAEAACAEVEADIESVRKLPKPKSGVPLATIYGPREDPYSASTIEVGGERVYICDPTELKLWANRIRVHLQGLTRSTKRCFRTKRLPNGLLVRRLG